MFSYWLYRSWIFNAQVDEQGLNDSVKFYPMHWEKENYSFKYMAPFFKIESTEYLFHKHNQGILSLT